MITLNGVDYGTAAEIAQQLGPDVTPKRIRDWASRDLIQHWNRPGRGRGTTYYRLDQAAAAERQTRTSTRGRKRQLDMTSAYA